MQYGTIPYVDKQVSRIIFGAAMKPFQQNGDDDSILDGMVELGINTIDLARVYGGAEPAIGRWMERRGNRKDLVLISKCAHPSDTEPHRVYEKAIRSDFAESSEALKTDFIDIYLLHRDDPSVPAGEIVEILNAMHREGKIGAFGGSNWTHQRIQEANDYAKAHDLIPFSVSSPNFGLADQIADLWGGGSVTISGPSNQEARDWYVKNDMPAIAYSSLAHGFFSGKVHSDEWEKIPEVLDEYAIKGYVCKENRERLRRCEQLASERGYSVAQVALAYIFYQPIRTFAVVSTSKPARMQSNIDAMNLELSAEDLAWLDLRDVK